MVAQTGAMVLDDDVCFRALAARDHRFDGQFFVGVVTTGIYCRPVCPARTPLRRNVRFYRSAATAAAAGLRACRRCRPDTLPGSREWDHRSDLVARALRLLGAGAADATGVEPVADALHVSSRHLNRALMAEVGVTAGQVARTRRAQTARLLLEHTDLPATEVAYAAGFRTVRQFNDVIRQEFGVTPTGLRGGRRHSDGRVATADTVTVRLGFRPPYAVASVLGWFARHAVAGVDEVTDAAITTTLLDGTRVGARFEASSVVVSLGLPPQGDVRDLPPVIAAVRRWLDLDATPARIDDHFAGIAPVAAWVQRRPGMRVPAAADPFRSVVGTIMGQQVSVGAAATLNARLIAHCGLTDRFPTAETLAACDADVLAHAVGIPATRARTLVTVAELVAGGGVELGPSADRDATVATLGSVRGVGPWTVAEVRMRALGDPDVWPAGDLILRRALQPGGPVAGLDPVAAAPWRSYLAHHVWIGHSVKNNRHQQQEQERA